MAGSQEVKHDYHLVNPSPWPMVGAIAAGLMLFGAVLWFKTRDDLVPFGMPVWTWFALGFAGVLATMYLWWSDIIKEAHGGDHKPVVQVGLRYGVVLFIISEVMFFVAFFWSFFDFSLFPRAATAIAPLVDDVAEIANINARGQWPPEGIHTFNPLDIPLLNTLILLLSGTTVTWAHHALLEGNRKSFLWGLGLTVALGLIFTGFQAFEYYEAYAHKGLTLEAGAYGSTFFMATGFHGLHVIIGTIFLAVNLLRGFAGHFSSDHHFGFEAAAWYWHFVDVVWLFLYVAVYWNIFGVLS